MTKLTGKYAYLRTIKIKIISDGTSYGTKVINEETGEPLGGIVDISWNIHVDSFADVKIQFRNIPVELTGEISLNDIVDDDDL